MNQKHIKLICPSCKRTLLIDTATIYGELACSECGELLPLDAYPPIARLREEHAAQQEAERRRQKEEARAAKLAEAAKRKEEKERVRREQEEDRRRRQIVKATQSQMANAPPQQSAVATRVAAPPPVLEAGHAAGAPSVNVYLPKRTSSLGIVSLVLGVVAFVMCWIPIIGMFSIPVGALGLLLAAIGVLVALARRGAGIGFPIGGGLMSAMALAVGIAHAMMVGTAIASIGSSLDQTLGAGGHTATAPALEWTPAGRAVKHGDIALRVASVSIGRVPLRSGYGRTETTSEDELLAIRLKLINRSDSKKVSYQSWMGGELSFTRDSASLTDNFGNSYKRITFGYGTEVVDHTESASLYPGKTLVDVLVFEPPVEAAEHLDLELPGGNIGGDGFLRIRIPRSMFK